MRDFLSQLGREAPALSLARAELAAYYTYIRVMQQYLSLSELNSLVILAGSSSWLANMPNASINICDYKLQIWSKYLNTSSVGYIGLQQHGFNTSKGLGTQSQSKSQSQSESRFKIEVNSYTKWHVRLDWLGMAPSASNAHCEPHRSMYITMDVLYYARTQIDFLSSTIPARKATSSDAQQSSLKCHDICLSLSLMSVWRFQALLLQKHCLSYCERK